MLPQSSPTVAAKATRDATSDSQPSDVNHADTTNVAFRTRSDGIKDRHVTGKKAVTRPELPCSHLERLPAELRSKLLSSMPDLQTLRSLIHASPILHAQYRHSRDSILRSCLGYEFDGFLVDAYATLISRPCEFGSPRTNDKITEFTEAYGNWLSTPALSPDLRSIDADQIRSLSAFHLSVAQPLAQRYCHLALTNLKQAILSSEAEETRQDTTVDALGLDRFDLQKSEKIRIFRAIYRYETFYNLFGRNEGEREGMLYDESINHLYFCRFDPWEAEAIGCIDLFITDKYHGILKRVKERLCPPNVRFRLEGGVYRYEEAFRLTAEVGGYLESTITRGLGIAVQLLAIDDDDELVIKFRQCLFREGGQDASVQNALSTIAQYSRRNDLNVPPNIRDDAEIDRVPIKFAGDAVPATGPPFAWVRLWGEIYSNIYGEYVPESVQRWGYVMWNKERWDFMGGDRLVAKQWSTAPDRHEQISMDYLWAPTLTE